MTVVLVVGTTVVVVVGATVVVVVSETVVVVVGATVVVVVGETVVVVVGVTVVVVVGAIVVVVVNPTVVVVVGKVVVLVVVSIPVKGHSRSMTTTAGRGLNGRRSMSEASRTFRKNSPTAGSRTVGMKVHQARIIGPEKPSVSTKMASRLSESV